MTYHLDKSKHALRRMGARRNHEETLRQAETKLSYGVGWRGGTLKKYPRQVEAKDGIKRLMYYLPLQRWVDITPDLFPDNICNRSINVHSYGVEALLVSSFS